MGSYLCLGRNGKEAVQEAGMEGVGYPAGRNHCRLKKKLTLCPEEGAGALRNHQKRRERKWP